MIFVCSYRHDTSGYDKQKYEAKFRKLKDEFKGKSSDTKHDVRLKRDNYASSLRKEKEHLDGETVQKEPKLSRIKRNGKFKDEDSSGLVSRTF